MSEEKFGGMWDLASKPLSVGDTVGMCVPYYKHLVIGTVYKLTSKAVTIEWTKGGNIEHTSRFSDQVVKI